ncbi:MAG: [Fe-Fe] hydrogenase large subunit C-terminal domain-containing protein [Oscillospiraceae bacterium]|nr:[Fe-Fe] hydrogenase large subunit C-terminal domain-containing protein [Oscillospiraceae bacterium]
MSEFLRLKKSNCKNCYKCIRHCPVKSIRFSGNQAHIVGDECILCGQCFVVCPQNAKEITDSTEKVMVMLSDSAPVVASIAPSFAAEYGCNIASLEAALKKLGFTAAEEASLGAALVSREYNRILEEEKPSMLISSCCHSVSLLIQKYYPEALKYYANVLSPMAAHCQNIKTRYNGAKTVFIGPCISKKDEAERSGGIVDAVLTFEELTAWLKRENIEIENIPDDVNKHISRLYPVEGGILRTMKPAAETGYKYIAVSGAEHCIEILKDISSGDYNGCFIEMSICKGSCVEGPAMENRRKPVGNVLKVENYAGTEEAQISLSEKESLHKGFTVIPNNSIQPTEQEIIEILHRMGKTRPEQELNCGSCGYNTCRDKAVAIYKGKADVSMCLPFLKEKAESFSDNIISNTPNAVIVLNESLEVQQINKAALSIMNLRSASDVLGEQVVRILDPKPFMDVKNTGMSIREKRTYLAEYRRYVEQTIIYDREYKIIMCTMRDVTDEETERGRKEYISKQTIEIADKVVDKQMRVVQEIASLLGETVAETKIALTKLKESISDE